MANLKKVNEVNFKTEVQDSDVLSVVEFGGQWCGPCKKLEPIMEELQEELAGRVKFFTVDVGESPDLAREYSVMSVPVTFIIKNGTIMESFNGFLPKAKLLQNIKQYLEG